MTDDELLGGFHRAMLGVYESAKRECGYNATRFLEMVIDRGGLETARSLLASANISDGFTALYLAGRLDLSMEAVVIKNPWRILFTEQELRIAEDRLKKVGFVALK